MTPTSIPVSDEDAALLDQARLAVLTAEAVAYRLEERYVEERALARTDVDKARGRLGLLLNVTAFKVGVGPWSGLTAALSASASGGAGAAGAGPGGAASVRYVWERRAFVKEGAGEGDPHGNDG